MADTNVATAGGPRVLIPAHWRPGSLKEILNREYVEPRWIIEGLLLEQSGTQVSGHPHATKSLNWLAAALESVTTHKVWGHFDASDVRRVLFIETEDPLVVVEERVRQLSKGLGIDPKDVKEGFFLSRTGPFELDKMEKELGALIETYKPDWLVISTLQGLLGERDWKERKDMSTVNAILVRLQELCPLVLITHSTWDTKNKRAAGTITQAANFLTTMHFEKKIKDGVTTTTVSLDSKMGFEEPEFDLVLETATVPGKQRPELRRVKYAGEHKPSDAELIKEYAKEHPDANPKEVSDAVGCSYECARKVMKKPAPELPKNYDPTELDPAQDADQRGSERERKQQAKEEQKLRNMIATWKVGEEKTSVALSGECYKFDLNWGNVQSGGLAWAVEKGLLRQEGQSYYRIEPGATQLPRKQLYPPIRRRAGTGHNSIRRQLCERPQAIERTGKMDTTTRKQQVSD